MRRDRPRCGASFGSTPVPVAVHAGARRLQGRPCSVSATTSVRASVGDHDEVRWLTVLSAGGLAVAAVLAVVGGLPFDLPMPTHAVGWVTPTCGLTRGSTALIRGDLDLAWHYNPASFAVMSFAVLGVVRAAVGRFCGFWVNVRLRPRRSWLVAVAILVLVLWAQQMTNASFIIHSRS